MGLPAFTGPIACVAVPLLLLAPLPVVFPRSFFHAVPHSTIPLLLPSWLWRRLQAVWDNDPLVMHMNTRVRNANEYLRITEKSMQVRAGSQAGILCLLLLAMHMRRACANPLSLGGLGVQRLEEVDFPFIVFHSENDTMVDVDGSKALYLRSKVCGQQLPPLGCV